MNARVRAAAVVLAAFWMAAVQASSRATNEEPCAPPRLADTGLYASGSAGPIAPGVRGFMPQYPLWSDGAAKSRWIYLPPGSTIDTTDSANWAFPVGTRFWKEFRFNGRKVETRFIWRATADRWIFASYAWNANGTDASLAPADGLPGAAEVAPGRTHTIPGTADCQACHGTRNPGPLGFNALQLSTDRDPNAIHGEPLAPGMTTIATLDAEHLLSPARPEWRDAPPRIHAESPRTRAVLGYFAANCGTCHNHSGDLTYRGPSLKHNDIGDGDAVARALLAQATTWQVPGRPDGSTRMLDAITPGASAMLVRMRSRQPSTQMPPLGTVIRDQAAIDAIEAWLATDLKR
jgi:hypothetical protein